MIYDLFNELNDVQLVLLILLGIAFLIQMTYYIAVYGKVSRYKQVLTTDNEKLPPLSVIICARDEYENLAKNLPIIAEQDYPNFEVVVVNDCSEDDTSHLLDNLSKKYPHLRQTKISKDDKFSHGKKLAVTIGVKSANNDILVFADADCMPKSDQWLRQIAAAYDDNTDIVLGYCGFAKSKGFLNRIIRCDAFFIGLNYLGLAMCKMPYMGVGRNMSYRKSLFLKNKGFASHLSLVSGDDDLFINEVANGNNTRVAISRTALLTTEAKKTYYNWTLQKIRHGSTYKRYKMKSKASLATEMISRLACFASAVVLALLLPFPLLFIPIGVLFVRLLTIAITFKTSISKLQEKGIWMTMLLFDIISPVLYLALYLKRKFSHKMMQWS